MSRTPHSSRHRSREVALQVLFALDLGHRDPEEPRRSVQDVFDGVSESFEMPEGAKAFAKELVFEVARCRCELDETLAAHSAHWRLSRMAAVDRNILRLATWELSHTETPAAVVLDEAVVLAQRFGGDASPAFVNGILDAVARSQREAAQ